MPCSKWYTVNLNSMSTVTHTHCDSRCRCDISCRSFVHITAFHRNSENNKLFHAAPPDCAFILLLFGQWSHLSFSGAEVKIHDVKKRPPPKKQE